MATETAERNGIKVTPDSNKPTGKPSSRQRSLPVFAGGYWNVWNE
jgi:hypothetical protein